jgi:hypothetical protein
VDLEGPGCRGVASPSTAASSAGRTSFASRALLAVLYRGAGAGKVDDREVVACRRLPTTLPASLPREPLPAALRAVMSDRVRCEGPSLSCALCWS